MCSKITYIIVSLFIIYGSFQYFPRWKQHGSEAVITWDVSGYYWYLPSAFIYKDLKHLSFSESILKKYAPTGDFQQAFRVDNGNYVCKYASGMAVMYLPAFTIANLSAKALDAPQDGFSWPYQLALQVQSLLVFLIGLWYFRRFLLYYFKDKTVAFSLAILVVGTNYLNYTAFDGSMTHNYLFTIYVILLLATRAFYVKPSAKMAVAMGLLMGLAILTRPTEIISILIPLLWGIHTISKEAIIDQFLFLKKHAGFILLTAMAAAPVTFIQLAYWKYVSGHWIVYSYQNQGFSFSSPHFAFYTFGFQTGWLVYTPMMMLTLIGLISFLRKGVHRPMVIVVSLLAYYIVTSWDVWWYGGRAMVQYYPLLFMVIATFIEGLLAANIVLKWLMGVVILVFAYVNIWWTLQAHSGRFYPGGAAYEGGLYDGNSMNNHYFWRVVGRLHAPDITLTLLDAANLYEGPIKDSVLIYQNNFDKDSLHYTFADTTQPKSDTSNIVFNHHEKKWLRVQATFHSTEKEWDLWKMPQFCIDVYIPGRDFRREFIRVHRFLGNDDTRKLYFDVNLKGQHPDHASIFLLNEGSKEKVTMDDVKVWTFNP